MGLGRGLQAGGAVIRLRLKRRVPSQNKSTYAHWSAYAKERDAWFALLRAGLVPKEKPNHRVRVVVESHRTVLLDKANLWGGTKAIWDGLVRLGYLRDDNPKWLDDDVRQFRVPRAEEITLVTIENP